MKSHPSFKLQALAWFIAGLAMPAAHAALFEDDEARRAILDLRQKVERQRGEIQQVGGEIQQIQRSLLDQQNQFEKLSAEIARLRGVQPQLLRDDDQLGSFDFIIDFGDELFFRQTIWAMCVHIKLLHVSRDAAGQTST